MQISRCILDLSNKFMIEQIMIIIVIEPLESQLAIGVDWSPIIYFQLLDSTGNSKISNRNWIFLIWKFIILIQL